jgi:TM2 domain-containing membrane protein YozV
MPFCETCGEEGGGDYCASCGEVRSFAAKAAAQKESRMVAAAPAGAIVVANQTHGVPALLSFFIPGLGQLIKGHVGKGLLTWGALSVSVVAGLALMLPFFAIPVVWIWSIYDAYRSNTTSIGAGPSDPRSP